MHEASWSSAEVRFLDHDKVLDELRRAAAEAKAAHPEILRIFLFGSLVQGNWTADSDADLIVVVRKEFSDIFERSHYQIHAHSIHTDTLVYSETEFQRMLQDHQSFLSRNIPGALEI